MQFSPIEIKEKLTRALDDDNNVSDISAVLEVIATLESYPITREALEQTRIGKMVNDLRKKTTNDDLARRAKKLVRSWHKLISPSDNYTVNGERINTNSPSPSMTVFSGGGAGSRPVSPASLRCSPALSKSSPYGISMSNKIHSPCLRVNATPGTPGLHPVSPKVDPNGVQRSNISPNLVCPLRVGPSLTSIPKGSNISPKNMCPRRVGTPSSSTPKEHSPNMSLSSTPTSKGICPNPPFGNSASNEGRCENSYQKNEPCSPAGCDRNCVSKEKTSLSKVGSLHLGKCSPISNHSKDRINAGIVNDQKNAVKGNLSKKRTLNDPGGGLPAKRVPPPEKYVAKDLHSKEKTVNGMCPNLESSEKKKPNEVLAKSKSVMDNCFMYVSGDSNDSFKNSANKRNLTVKQDKTKISKVKTTAQLIAELQAKSGVSSSHLKGDVIEKIRANQIKRESNNILPSDIHLKSNKRDSRQPHNMLSQAKTELVQKFLQTSVRPNDIKEESESPLSIEMDPCRLQLECNLPDGPTMSAAHELASMSATQQSLLDIYNMLPPLDLDQIDWEDDTYEVPERTEPVSDGDVDRLHSEQWSGVNGMWDSVGMWRDWTQTMSAESLEGSRIELLPYVNID